MIQSEKWEKLKYLIKKDKRKEKTQSAQIFLKIKLFICRCLVHASTHTVALAESHVDCFTFLRYFSSFFLIGKSTFFCFSDLLAARTNFSKQAIFYLKTKLKYLCTR